jgi:hypothetical protein
MRKSLNVNKFIRSLIYGFHMTGNTNKQNRGVDQKTSQYLLWPFASCSATHLLHIELIRLLIVACGMLSLSSSNGCVKFLDIGGTWNHAHVDPEHPKRAQCVSCLVSMQDMEELGHVQLPGIVYRSLRHGAEHYHAET